MSEKNTHHGSAIPHQRFNIGGIHTVVYNLEDAKRSNLPVTVLIATHGRGEDQFHLTDLVEGTYKKAAELDNKAGGNGKRVRELIVVTLDQRNHGERKVDDLANQGFEKNDRHAVDMYAMHRGTARDISFLIDFLPAYLFPEGEKTIEKFAVTGVSLGGHASWIVLRDEPRVTIGIPIIGCPDYYSMLSERIARKPPSNGQRTLVGPAFPPSFAQLVAKDDPCAIDYASHDPAVNPYIGKQILVLGGQDDKLVPPKFGEKMYEGLYVGEDGAKNMIIQEGVGHRLSKEMIERVGEWIWRYGLSSGQAAAPVVQSSQL
ncbi:hypothetical protein QFC22_000511 [Naganishia vaughanmartiniae]|uniref:Uncharacterized protein n=1 Tax=Naganishia vaughanmartiniae TaxID=1424756 RepID=A0ACC2XQA0_9TREE|nr:hypothetical protein QFC22_000511 [Naganishia vaughanmartiniae]